MASLNTRLTRLLGIKTPVVLAPMAIPGSLDRTAIAVHKAGGFGFTGAGTDDAPKIRTRLQSIRTELHVPPSSPLPIGVGVLCWIADKHGNEGMIPAILGEHPKAIWLAFGTDLGKYVKQIREYNEKNGTKILVVVSATSLEEALQAANEWKVDVLNVQGTEAGGHLSASAPTLSVFLTAVVTALESAQDPPILLGAGGISTGAQVASLLTLGASGAVVGSRFLVTPEVNYAPARVQALLDADLKSTVISMAFDEVRDTMGWPEGVSGRGLRNDIIKDEEEGASLEERVRRFNSGEGFRQVIYAGMGIALTKEVKSAEDIVKELHEDTVKALRASVQILS